MDEAKLFRLQTDFDLGLLTLDEVEGWLRKQPPGDPDEPCPVPVIGAPLRIKAEYNYTGSHHVEFTCLEYTISLPKELWRAQGRPDTIFVEIPSLVRGM